MSSGNGHDVGREDGERDVRALDGEDIYISERELPEWIQTGGPMGAFERDGTRSGLWLGLRRTKRGKWRAVKREQGEVLYVGNAIVLVWRFYDELIAYPRGDPKGRERDYLALMIDELRRVSKRVFKFFGDVEMSLNAYVVYGNVEFKIWIGRRYGMRIYTLMEDDEKDTEEFIRTADDVELEFATGSPEFYYYEGYLGRRIAVIGGEWGGRVVLYAYPRFDVVENRRMDPVSLMLEVIREVRDNSDELLNIWNWEIHEAVVRGYVLRNGINFAPAIDLHHNDIDFWPWDVSYVDFVQAADEVRIIPRR